MQPMLPLNGGGIGWNFFIGILIWGVVAPILSFLGVIATTYACWNAGEDGLRLRAWMVVLLPLSAVLAGVGGIIVVSGSVLSDPDPGFLMSSWIPTVPVPIGMGVVVGSGLYWRQWAYVGVGLGVMLAGLVAVGTDPANVSLEWLIFLGLLPVISAGVGYLSSGDGGEAQEQALPEATTGINR